MAVKKRRRKFNSAVKIYRFVKKQRRRRAHLHPTRRRQETLALTGAVASVPLLVFIGIPAAVFVGVASAFIGFASKASPPPSRGSSRRKPKNLVTGGEEFSGIFTKKEAIRLVKKRSTCSDACKYSTHEKSTCDCVCRGASHGIWAWGPAKTTTPNKPPSRRKPKPQKTRRQVRKTARKRP